MSSMDIGVVLFLSILGLGWSCDGRELGRINRVSRTDVQQLWKVQLSEFGRNEQICSLCEEFVVEASKYLAENKTQTEIIEILHKSCSKLPSYEQQCILLVDYYAPLFFREISLIQPEDFCRKFGLCENVVQKFLHLPKESCDFCHRVVTEAMTKLKDPDMQLEVIEILVKACDAAERFGEKCKKLVLEYAPVFLETNDICNMLHANACGTWATSSTSMHPSH